MISQLRRFIAYNISMKLTDNDKLEIRKQTYVTWNRVQTRIEDLKAQGITIKELGEILGIAPRTLYRLLSTPQNIKPGNNNSLFFKHFQVIAALLYMKKFTPRKPKRKYKRHNKAKRSGSTT